MISAAEIIKENAAAKQAFTDSMMKFFYGNHFYENNSSERYIGNRDQSDESRHRGSFAERFMTGQIETQIDSSIAVPQNYFWIWHRILGTNRFQPLDSDTEDGEDMDSMDSEEARMYRNR